MAKKAGINALKFTKTAKKTRVDVTKKYFNMILPTFQTLFTAKQAAYAKGMDVTNVLLMVCKGVPNID